MDRMIYLSMSGAKAMLQRQDVLTHNLANVSTAGFRAELAAFRAVPVRGDGASTRVYALESTNGYSDAPGLVENTGRALDVALNGKAMTAASAAMMAGTGSEFITVVELIAAAMMPLIAKTWYGPDGTGPIDPGGRKTSLGNR